MRSKLFTLLIEKTFDNPKKTFALIGAVTLLLCTAFPFVKIDVDPENMLEKSEPARVYHNLMKERMDIQDMIILGITDDSHPQGVFNPDSMGRILKLSQFIYAHPHVVGYNLLSPDKVDAIEPAGPGTLRFERLIQESDLSGDRLVSRRSLAEANPFLKGTMVSEDGKGLALFIPITEKDKSWGLRKELQNQIKTLGGKEQYHITGLPVAEDTFGVEMFIQMAVSAPLAMGLITFLMWLFFRNFRLVGGSMMTALISVLTTMGLFIASGQTLHIMSSMIPIFIMPIAVLDDVHILSQFYDKYDGDRRGTLLEVMEELWRPMIFTSITSSVGFLSLVLAPIPPVRVFGFFTALGILIAWAVTMAILPAYIASLPEKTLQDFGLKNKLTRVNHAKSILSRLLTYVGTHIWDRAWINVGSALIIAVLAWIGLNRIKVNDNPMKWFEEEHPIRAADKVMNERFAGNYIAYLSLSPKVEAGSVDRLRQKLAEKLEGFGEEGAELKQALAAKASFQSPLELLSALRTMVSEKVTGKQAAPATVESIEEEPDFEFNREENDPRADRALRRWLDIDSMIEAELSPFQSLKDPAMLKWMSEASSYIERTGFVAKANSVSDLVKKINKELHEGNPEFYEIPQSREEVMETYISFQSSHDLHRLWQMITNDYGAATMKFQLKSGDNQDVERAVLALNAWMEKNPAPTAMEPAWFGLSYINILWQKKMVRGMSNALIGSAVVVFFCMLLLLRSILWALLSFIPLAMAIGTIYGSIGLMGKDYDMPVAVISALALGLAVDFAIHFIVCLRQFAQGNPPAKAMNLVFQEPARGILRNAIVVALGFTPLLAAPLIPYQTVGLMMASILIVGAMSTLILLPSIISLGRRFFFRDHKSHP